MPNSAIGEPTNRQIYETLQKHLEAEPTVGGWHLKKEIQLGHIVTTMTVLFSVVWYAGKLEQRIALTEQQISQIQTAQKDRELSLSQRFDRLESKIDRVLETRK